MLTPHYVSHVMCQVSGVTCHVSGIRCHMSCVRCHVSGVKCYFFWDKVLVLVGGGYVIIGAYPVQFIINNNFTKKHEVVSWFLLFNYIT